MLEIIKQGDWTYKIHFESVEQLLVKAGWKKTHFASARDLATPLKDPEDEPRVFVVAHR